MEIVIDERLAASESWQVGTSVFAANHHWKIVGIVPAGAMTRVFMPRRIAQFLFGSGNIRRSTLMFVKLNEGVDIGRAARAIARTTDQDVVPQAAYRSILADKFGKMFVYVDAVNAVAMVIAFLFTMVTLYSAVLQRRREIAILKSCGASGVYIWRQVMGEALLLTAGGVAVGVAMSFAGGWIIETLLPLMTVTITLPWIAIAIAAAAAGAAISSIYPAWRAVKVDMVEALSFE